MADTSALGIDWGNTDPPPADTGGKASPAEFGRALDALGIKDHPDDVDTTGPMLPGETATDAQGRKKVYIRSNRPNIVGQVANQTLEGIPILSPLVDKATAAVGAAVQPLIGNYEPTFGERYANNLTALHQESQREQAEHPIVSGAANVAGAVTSAIPLAMSGPGAVAMGLRGPSLAWRMLGGSAGQSAIGGTDAALRGDSPLVGAGVGAVGGALGPAIGEGIGAGARGLMNYSFPPTGPLAGVNPINTNRLINALSGETDQSLAAASQRVGPNGFVGDLNQGLTDLTGATAVTPGTGKGVVRSAYQGRADAQGQRIEDALTTALGPKVDQVQLAAMTTQARKAAADPLYEQWRNMQVQPTQGIKDLLPRLQKAKAFGMAQELAGISGEPINQNFFTTGPQKAFPTTQSWDYIKQALDRRISQAYNKEGGGPLARVLVGLKQDMLDEIEKTPAGKVWKQARQEFADHSALLDQQAAGRDTFLGGRSGTTVDELRHELATLSGPELFARQQGLRAAAQEALGATETGDTRLRTLMLAPNNQEKIRLMMGMQGSGPVAARTAAPWQAALNKLTPGMRNPQDAEDLINTLKQEKGHSDKAMDVLGNNATGASNVGRAERKNMLMPDPAREYGIDFQKPATWVPPSIRDQFSVSGMINSQRQAAHSAANEQLARILTLPNSPPSLAILRAVQNEGARQAMNYGRSQAASNLIGGALAGPGTSVARRQLPAR